MCVWASSIISHLQRLQVQWRISAGYNRWHHIITALQRALQSQIHHGLDYPLILPFPFLSQDYSPKRAQRFSQWQSSYPEMMIGSNGVFLFLRLFGWKVCNLNNQFDWLMMCMMYLLVCNFHVILDRILMSSATGGKQNRINVISIPWTLNTPWKSLRGRKKKKKRVLISSCPGYQLSLGFLITTSVLAVSLSLQHSHYMRLNQTFNEEQTGNL